MTSLSSMQVNPSYFGQQVEQRVDNEPRQVLFLPKAPAHGAPGYNTSFQFRVCVTEASGNSRVCDPDKYSDIATATVVVLPHNLPPVAVAPPTPPTLREDFDAVEGVLITLGGSDPEGETTQAQIVIPRGFQSRAATTATSAAPFGKSTLSPARRRIRSTPTTATSAPLAR